MKKIFLGIGLALALLPSGGRAELLFYQGNLRMERIGNGGRSAQTYQTTVVLDLTNGALAKISSFSARGFKLYSVEELDGLQVLAVAAPYRRTNSVVAQAQTTVDASNQVVVSSLFVQGANSRLAVKSGEVADFPRILNWDSREVSPFAGTDLSQTWFETGVVAFRSSDTISSNKRGETLAEAEARLIAGLQAKGYSQFTLK